MPSLFSRAKATTGIVKLHHQRPLTPDDFGQTLPLTTSGSSGKHHPTATNRTSGSGSRDKESKSKRLRTDSGLSGAGGGVSSTDLPADEHGFIPLLPDGSYVPLVIPPKRTGTQQEYGYISAESDAFLGFDEVNRLVEVVGKELNTRGLQTPLLFSTQALDVSAARVRSLIRTFLATCQDPNISHSPTHQGSRKIITPAQAEAKWLEETSFADPHALGMILKWGLARLARVQSGFELSYPPDHFPTFLNTIPPITHTLFMSLFSLFSRLCANSQSSGLTPQTLATHFGPLIFGLGAPSLPFGSTYTLYLRSVHATEHLILSYIVNADYEARHGVVLPTRLKHWVKGYPSMLPKNVAELDKTRTTVRTIRVASVRRNIRLYSSDLFQTATLWCGEGDLTGRKEWTRIVPSMRGEFSEPKYADDYKKRLNLSKTFEPKTKYNSQTHLRATESSMSLPCRNPIDDLIDRTHPELASSASTLVSLSSSEDRFKNLTELKWGIFAETGFDNPNSKLLQFDLSETARRNARTARNRDTISWNDFSELGFDRLPSKPAPTGGDPRYNRTATPIPPLSYDPLSDALQFNVPVDSPSAWTDHSVDLHRKLKKQQKNLPQFGWETTPVAGREWIIEEGMATTWCELCLSSRWVDWNEGTFRESNWALVEFKALPENPSSSRDRVYPSHKGPPEDPRTSSQWILFEEFVPREYRDQLQNPKKKSFLFASLNKQRSWKPAATLNGQPYTGRPRSPNPKDFEFDAMLRHSESKTKIISLSTPPPLSHNQPVASRKATMRSHPSPASLVQAQQPRTLSPERQISSPLYVSPRAEPARSPSHPSRSTVPLPRFRLGKSRPQGADYDPDIKFETKTESSSSLDSVAPEVPSKSDRGHRRRESKDDAWVDILVLEAGGKRTNTERLGVRTRQMRSLSDPEKARTEIQKIMETGGSLRLSEDNGPGELSKRLEELWSLSNPASQEEVETSTPVYSPDVHVRPSTITSGGSVSTESSPYYRQTHSRYREIGMDEYQDRHDDDLATPYQTPEEVEFPQPPRAFGSDQSPKTPIKISLTSSSLPPSKPVLEDDPPTSVVPPDKPRGTGKGGISSLIQMYQQKDDDVAASHSPRPSRLPIRQLPVPPDSTPSPEPLLGQHNVESPTPRRPSGIPISITKSSPSSHVQPSIYQLPDPQASQKVAHSTSSRSSPPPNEDDPEDDKPLIPPGAVEHIPRIPSPGRYIHGAPLHNVLEEEEED